MFGIFSIRFENGVKREKEKRNILPVNNKKQNVLGMGIDGWLEQWFSKCGPGTTSNSNTGNYWKHKLAGPSLERERGGERERGREQA